MARLKVSIVFDSGARIGGKAKLLEGVRDTGSISAAAREMGMSYKRARLLLDSINQAFTELVVTAAPGGAGGGATLTVFDAEVLERYRRFTTGPQPWRASLGVRRTRLPLPKPATAAHPVCRSHRASWLAAPLACSPA